MLGSSGAGRGQPRLATLPPTGVGQEATFNLNCPNGPPELRENYGFSIAQLNRISAALAADLEHLCAEWSRIHESE